MALGKRFESGSVLAAYIAPCRAQAGDEPDIAGKRVQQFAAIVMLKGQAAHGPVF
jgi:hypothetical protein